MDYLGITVESIEELIRPEAREEFEQDKHIWFVSFSPSKKMNARTFQSRKGDQPGQVKFSMKAVNKAQFLNPMEKYKCVLSTKENFRACNEGICAKDQSMATYKQWKNALTYFYPKHEVLDDGRSTRPLKI